MQDKSLARGSVNRDGSKGASKLTLPAKNVSPDTMPASSKKADEITNEEGIMRASLDKWSSQGKFGDVRIDIPSSNSPIILILDSKQLLDTNPEASPTIKEITPITFSRNDPTDSYGGSTNNRLWKSVPKELASSIKGANSLSSASPSPSDHTSTELNGKVGYTDIRVNVRSKSKTLVRLWHKLGLQQKLRSKNEFDTKHERLEIHFQNPSISDYGGGGVLLNWTMRSYPAIGQKDLHKFGRKRRKNWSSSFIQQIANLSPEEKQIVSDFTEELPFGAKLLSIGRTAHNIKHGGMTILNVPSFCNIVSLGYDDTYIERRSSSESGERQCGSPRFGHLRRREAIVVEERKSRPRTKVSFERDDIIIRREDREWPRENDFEEEEIFIRKDNRERERSSEGEYRNEELIVRKDERERPREGNREEIIIRRNERTPEPPEPETETVIYESPPIRAPSIHQEIITHHRYIDHGTFAIPVNVHSALDTAY